MADNFLNNWALERLLTWLIEKIRQTWVFCPNKQTKKKNQFNMKPVDAYF